MLNIDSTVVSIDTMGTQRNIAEAIIEAKGDYLLSVKANQKSLFNELNDHFEFALKQLKRKKLNPENWSSSETFEVSRGREQTRKVLVCHNLEWMEQSIREKWKNLGSVIMVYRHTILEDGSQRSQISFYMIKPKQMKCSITFVITGALKIAATGSSMLFLKKM